MDISALIPLLLGGNKDASAIIAAMNAMKNRNTSSEHTDKTADPRAEILKTVAGQSTNPETINALATMMSAQNEKRKAHGFNPILPFVCNDILGKMDKFMSKKR